MWWRAIPRTLMANAKECEVQGWHRQLIELLICDAEKSSEEKGYFVMDRDFGGENLEMRIRIPENQVG